MGRINAMEARSLMECPIESIMERNPTDEMCEVGTRKTEQDRKCVIDEIYRMIQHSAKNGAPQVVITEETISKRFAAFTRELDSELVEAFTKNSEQFPFHVVWCKKLGILQYPGYIITWSDPCEYDVHACLIL